MRACNCGETLSSSVQKNAAEIKVAIKARQHSFERAHVLIAPRACLQHACRASNFLVRTAQRLPPYLLLARLSARFSTPLKSDAMISAGRIPRRRSGQDEVGVLAILHVRIGIGHHWTEIQVSEVAPAVQHDPA